MTATNLLSPRSCGAARRALLAWYDLNKRDLPWRRSPNPYRVWLSEIMLQQTRVAAVLEHSKAFLRQFPNVRALAGAPIDSVLAAWSGLGYYRRARALHESARQIVREHGGSIPQTVQELGALPGIGRYTSAAIASIAFGLPVAVVDGNVERVLSRMFVVASGKQAFWTIAQSLLDTRRPGDWNQAMMELGATLCAPKEPSCGACPLRRWCSSAHKAASEGVRISSSARAVPRRKRHMAYALAQRKGSVYLVRRAADQTLMPGMWELPEAHAAGRALLKLRHAITVTDYEITVLDCAGRPTGGQWIALTRIPELPLTGLARKILRQMSFI